MVAPAHSSMTTRRPKSLDTDQEVRERAEARAELERRLAIESHAAWMYHVDGLLYPRAFEPLCLLWDDIYHGKQVFALVEGPPRMGKSTIAFHGIARYLLKKPEHLCAWGTYSVKFAAEQSAIARDVAARSGVWVTESFEETEERFGLSQSVYHWQTPEKGGAKFVGRGGSLVGTGANVFCVEDPIKNDEEATSTAISDKAWQWIRASCIPRLEPNGSFIIQHQRWNDLDPIGRVKAQIEDGYPDLPKEVREQLVEIDWRVITLPAILPNGRALFPQRYTVIDLMRIRAIEGEDVWAGQYMQDPNPPGSRMFPENFPVWEVARDSNGNELGVVVRGEWIPVPPLNGKVLIFGVDSAGTVNIRADWTAVVLLAVYWEFDPQTLRLELAADVVSVWRERMESPDVVPFVASIASVFPSALVVYETQGGDGRAQAQFLEREHPEIGIATESTTRNKRLRAGPYAGAAKRGRVRVPVKAPWVPAWLLEHRRFTGQEGRKDDQVDAGAHAWNKGLTMPRPYKGQTGGERRNAMGGY